MISQSLKLNNKIGERKARFIRVTSENNFGEEIKKSENSFKSSAEKSELSKRTRSDRLRNSSRLWAETSPKGLIPGNATMEHIYPRQTPVYRRTLRSVQTQYEKLVQVAVIVSTSTSFSVFMVVWIVVGAVVIGAESYPTMDDEFSLIALNSTVAAFFTLEVAVKFISEGYRPWLYFTGPERGWNVFNLIIVAACYSDFHINMKHLRILRLIRVFRVAKLVEAIPQLRVIVTGLIGCLIKVMYILILLFMTYFIYSIFALEVFRENDPFFFGQLHRSLITLFKSSTMEDWHDVMYINVWGCNNWRHGIYVEPGSEEKLRIFWCSNPRGTMIAVVYFLSFMILAALLMMSLVIGGIILEMENTLEEMKGEVLQVKAARTAKIKMNKAEKIASLATAGLDNQQPSDFMKALSEQPHKGLERMTTRDFIAKEDRQNFLLRHLMLRAWTGMEVNKLQEEHFYFEHPNRFVRVYARFSLKSGKIAKSKIFNNFIIAIILAASVTIGAETFDNLKPSQLHTLNSLDTFFAIVFALEVVLKVIAEEFEPWRYFNSSWNIFDFTVASGSLISIGIGAKNSQSAGKIFIMMRLLRLLRVLRLITQLPFLQVLVSAMVKSSQSILSLGSIIFLVDYIFAVIGFTLFSDNDPLNFKALHLSMFTLFKISTREDWSQTMFINAYGCDQLGYEEWPWMCTHPSGEYLTSVAFHIIFVVIAALVLIALFIGVVTTTMSEEDSTLKAMQKVSTRVLQIQVKYQLSNKCVQMYRDVFDFMDIDGGGAITLNELEMGLKSIGKNLTQQQLDNLFAEIDVDESGEIDFSELLECMAILRFNGQQLKKKKARDWWKKVKGKIPAKEVTQLKAQASSAVQGLRRSSIQAARNIKRSSVVAIKNIQTTSEGAVNAIRRSSMDLVEQLSSKHNSAIKKLCEEHTGPPKAQIHRKPGSSPVHGKQIEKWPCSAQIHPAPISSDFIAPCKPNVSTQCSENKQRQHLTIPEFSDYTPLSVVEPEESKRSRASSASKLPQQQTTQSLSKEVDDNSKADATLHEQLL